MKPKNSSREIDRLPHQLPMRLIDSVLARATGIVVCRALVPDDYPVAWHRGHLDGADHGAVPSVVAIEIAAQASALLTQPHLVESSSESESAGRVGYLVSVRRSEFLSPSLPTATPLLVRAVEAGHAGPLQRITFELIREPELSERSKELDPVLALAATSPLLARGTLGTFQSDESGAPANS